MTEINSNRDTVNVEEHWHPLFKELTEGGNNYELPFKTMKDMFMWAASLGYQQGHRKPLSGKKTTIFRWAQFQPQIDVPLLKALTIADGGELGFIINQDQILNIAEEYANAGLYQIQEALKEEGGNRLMTLVKMTE